MSEGNHAPQIFGGKLSVNPDTNVADLLAQACEPLVSADVMALNLVSRLRAPTAIPYWALRRLILLRD